MGQGWGWGAREWHNGTIRQRIWKKGKEKEVKRVKEWWW